MTCETKAINELTVWCLAFGSVGLPGANRELAEGWPHRQVPSGAERAAGRDRRPPAVPAEGTEERRWPVWLHRHQCPREGVRHLDAPREE